MQKIIRAIWSLQKQADEYTQMGRDFPTSGAGNLNDQLKSLLSDAEQKAAALRRPSAGSR